jgi:hypothetical protein
LKVVTRTALGLGAALVLGVAAAAGAAPPPSSLAAVGGLPKLPAGAPGAIAIVLQGPYGSYSPGTILPVVLRNNTKRPVTGIHVTGPALDPKGRVLADGVEDEIQPTTVPPGGLAIGFVRFGGANLAKGTRFKLVVTDTPAAADLGFTKQVDVPITSLRFARGRLTGIATNTTRKKVSRPVVVLAACFDRAGRLITLAKALGAKNSAAAGGKIPFTVDFTGGGKRPAPACKHVLASMTGYSEL